MRSRLFKSLWTQLVLDTGLPNPNFFHRIGLILNCCGRLILSRGFEGLKYCINYIWLKCLYWNILHSTYDKTVVVKFCEGWPLQEAFLLWLICKTMTVKYVFYVRKLHILNFDTGYGHCATLGATLTPLYPPHPTPPTSCKWTPHVVMWMAKTHKNFSIFS